jgi:flagellar motor component MotA
MAYTLSFILFLIVVFGFGIDFMPIGLQYLWNFPSIILIFIPAYVFAIASSDYSKVKVFRSVFRSRKPIDNIEAEATYYFLRTLGNAALFLGLIWSISMLMLVLPSILDDPSKLGPNMAVGMIVLFYALIVKIFAYTAGYKVLFRSGLEVKASTSRITDICLFMYPIIPVFMLFILLFAVS